MSKRINTIPKRERRSMAIIEALLIALALIWFVPIYYLIVTTFKTPQDATNNPLGLPEVWVFENYVSAW